MGLELAKAYVTARGDASKVGDDLRAGKAGVASAAQGLQTTVNRILAGIGIGFGISKLISEMREGIGLAQIQIDAEAKVAAVIKGTGGAAGFTADELKKMASAMQEATTFGDEGILEMQSRLLTFKTITGDVFKSASKVVLNMAATLGTSAAGAALQLGRALEDPIRGVTALRRTGVSFSEQQKAYIKQLVESNQLSKAQAYILDTVQGQLGEVAEAMAATDSGKLKQAQNTLGDIKEELGKHVLPAQTLFVKMQSEMMKGTVVVVGWIKQWITENKTVALTLGGISAALGTLTVGLVAARIAVRLLGISFRTILLSTGIGIAFVALGALVGWLMDKFELLKNIGPWLEDLKERFAGWWEQIRIGLRVIKNVAVMFWDVFVNYVKLAIVTAGDILRGFFGSVKEWTQPWIDAFKENFMAFVENLDVMLGSFGGFRSGIIYYMEQAAIGFKMVWTNMKNFVGVKFLEMTKLAINWAADFSKDYVETATPTLARFFIWWQKKLAWLRGEEWLMTPEEEEATIRSAQDEMIKTIDENRLDAQTKLDAALKKMEEEKQRMYEDLGEQSLDSLKKFQDAAKDFGKLSDVVKDLWAEAKEEIEKEDALTRHTEWEEERKKFVEEQRANRRTDAGEDLGAAAAGIAGKGKAGLIGAGSFGFADFGKKIQDMVLQKDDPQKKIEENTRKAAMGIAEWNTKASAILNKNIPSAPATYGSDVSQMMIG